MFCCHNHCTKFTFKGKQRFGCDCIHKWFQTTGNYFFVHCVEITYYWRFKKQSLIKCPGFGIGIFANFTYTYLSLMINWREFFFGKRANSNLHGICACEWKEQVILFDNSCPNLSRWAVPLPVASIWMFLKGLLSGRGFCWKTISLYERVLPLRRQIL